MKSSKYFSQNEAKVAEPVPNRAEDDVSSSELNVEEEEDVLSKHTPLCSEPSFQQHDLRTM